ncbi:hypothetical protein N5E89_03335 [Comamonas aquatica]|nr:hypothetical protein [Comamonas aquatica]MDH1427393.1 hypothetical protein [Comamonas aquatica]MDH1619266.1 hypothetical protein [Comamonas aquatica]
MRRLLIGRLHKILHTLEPEEHAAHALRLIADFSWLRAQELGRYMHPNNPHARKYAEKYLRKLQALRYVIARKLPGRHAGAAFVLSQRGATWLNERGHAPAARAGTRYGEIRHGTWRPPGSWKHDLWSIGVLFLLREQRGFDVWTESQLRQLEPNVDKHPDGLLVGASGCTWLEVENARKTGKNRMHMLQAVMLAARSTASVHYPNLPAFCAAIIAVPADAKDLHGRKIHHEENITRQIATIGVKAKTTIVFCTMHFRGAGVEKITLKPVTFLPQTPTPGSGADLHSSTV